MKDENPPAFPVATEHHVHTRGMSLRDWFAGQMMTNLGQFPVVQCSDEELRRVAEQIYRMADAMLAHRQKGQTDADA